jgi:SAM-dependent methyltransferase
MRRMTPDDPWLGAVWPFVRSQLPPAPARVLEVGCGTVGGFVPALLDDGYQALGVDPEAPGGPDYRRIEFEQYEPPHPMKCVVASLSLHHVADLDEALDRLEALLAPGGVLVVVEWAWERFDEATARWCFARLDPPAPGAEPGWLCARRVLRLRPARPGGQAGHVTDRRSHHGSLATQRNPMWPVEVSTASPWRAAGR